LYIVAGDHLFYGGGGRDAIDAGFSSVGVDIDLRPDPAEGAGYFSSALGTAWLYDFENAHVGDWLDGGDGFDTCADPDGWIVLDNCEA
jgi:hypothetical protein